jgi:hypothetical protein
VKKAIVLVCLLTGALLVPTGAWVSADPSPAQGDSTSYKGFPVVHLSVNGVNIETDVPAIVFYGRTLVPARVVAESLGYSVSWDLAAHTARITGRPVSEVLSELEEANRLIERLKEKIILLGGNPAELPPEPPVVPAGVEVETASHTARVGWEARAGSVGYRVYVAGQKGADDEQPGGYEVVASTSETYFEHQGLNNGYAYFYLVSSIDAAGREGWLSDIPAVARPRREGSDSDPPVLRSFSMPLQVRIGQEFTISADIYDEVSGVYWGGARNGVSGSPVQIRMAPFGASGPTLDGIFAYSPATGLWSAKVTFPQNFPTGEWGVMGLLLVDWVGNTAYLTPDDKIQVEP